MDKKTLLDILYDIKERDTGDPEADHIMADEALLRYIDDMDVSRAFDDIKKEY